MGNGGSAQDVCGIVRRLVKNAHVQVAGPAGSRVSQGSPRRVRCETGHGPHTPLALRLRALATAPQRLSGTLGFLTPPSPRILSF